MSAILRNRRQHARDERHMAMPMESAAKAVTVAGFKRCVTSLFVAGILAVQHVLNVSKLVLRMYCLASAIFLHGCQKMSSCFALGAALKRLQS